jgi:tetratricopeptide (TPR) repeat protein
LSTVLLVPYFVWGFYTLNRRFRYHDEFSLAVEAGTLACLMIFFALEFFILRTWMMRESPLVYIFSLLGLFGSGAALYGHMAVSLGSRLMVGMIVPGPDEGNDQPRLGAAEGLERISDWEGAYNEYLVLARIYPKDAEVPLRAAEALVRMKREEEAITWFERALGRCSEADRGLHVLNRLTETLQHQGRREEGRAQLTTFLRRFPDGESAAIVRERLERFDTAPKARAASISSLDEEALEEVPASEALAVDPLDDEMPSIPVKLDLQDLDSLDAQEVDGDDFSPTVKDRPSSLGIQKLGDEDIEAVSDDEPERPTSRKLSEQGLEALDEVRQEDDSSSDSGGK